MGLENLNVIDAVGTETDTGVIVLTIIDGWDWKDEIAHLTALQAKLNAYFEFVETGQLEESYAEARGQPRRLEILANHPLPLSAQRLIDQASVVALDGLHMEVIARVHSA